MGQTHSPGARAGGAGVGAHNSRSRLRSKGAGTVRVRRWFAGSGHGSESPLVRGGTLRGRRRAEGGGRCCLGGGAECFLRCEAARSPRRALGRHGVLPVQQRGHCGALRAARTRLRARSDRRLGRPPRQRYARRVLRRRVGFLLQRAPVPALPRYGTARRARGRSGARRHAERTHPGGRRG